MRMKSVTRTFEINAKAASAAGQPSSAVQGCWHLAAGVETKLDDSGGNQRKCIFTLSVKWTSSKMIQIVIYSDFIIKQSMVPRPYIPWRLSTNSLFLLRMYQTHDSIPPVFGLLISAATDSKPFEAIIRISFPPNLYAITTSWSNQQCHGVMALTLTLRRNIYCCDALQIYTTF